ncbi:tripartite tricarboxylate transporter TctB family protein [Palleronia aestuarii]|uniref:Tripartite tricarboxylate transporter TctB family protein n=1 Tax=Palleronia aestuarii TaxID=568105 RepID=A0A2W7N8S7_9RHOB|nr:tripartite tricarboxylate transporter TctB family protein [Palleronia aestuarii]PZX16488.1 tripartite tricarboxylate transporter TctB family protein [Palleronia aestuarii]
MGRILVSLAAIALVVLFRIRAAEYPETAARLPNLIGWVVAGLACLAILQVVLNWRRQNAEGRLEILPPPDWQAIGIGGGFLLLILLYAWSITTLGYLIATPLFMLIPFLGLRPISPLAAVATTAAVTAFIWFVFVWFLNLSIPLYPAM